MTEPAKSVRLQILEQVYKVLSAIEAGDTYNYTPASVSFRFRHWSEIEAFPAYMISVASGGKMEASASAQPEIEYTEEFYVSIKAVVRDEEDTVTAMEKVIEDIRTAILADARSSTAGSLGMLSLMVEMDEPPITDDGYLSLEGYAFCDLRVKFTIINYY